MDMNLTPLFILCVIAVPIHAEVNLALNKNASMSSIEESYTADRAVDGNTAQTLASGSCSSTQVDAFDIAAWWRVDLGGVYSITRVNIYYKNTDLYRFSGFQVFITNTPDTTSSTPCYKDNNGLQGEPFPGSVISLSNCNGQGRYVTVYKTRAAANTCTPGVTNVNFCSILELCEVQVYGCEEGKYGTSCSLDCSANCASGSCDATSGNCIDGCKDGYTGSKCDAQCSSGRYGAGCTDNCGNCRLVTATACDFVSGNCTEGCMDGWKVDLCQDECDQGFYGADCAQQCSNCLNDDCDHVYGNCTSGCKTGWLGPYCTTAVKCNVSEIVMINSELVDSTLLGTDVEMNGTVELKCKKGYNHTDGDKYRSCSEYASWRGESLNCSLCKCPCRNYIAPNDTEALATWEKEMKEELTWDPKETSKYKRTKVSAEDNSVVSKSIGMALGVGILAFVGAILVLPDIPRIAKDFYSGFRYHKIA